MSEPKYVTLNTGAKFLVVGYGTWMGHEGDADFKDAKRIILNAIKIGYRHIDTALLYKTEGAVGEAIRESGIPREEFFVVTKLWNHHHQHVQHALDLSLRNLGLDYVDLYLIHFPIGFEYDGDDYNFRPKNEDGSLKLDESGWTYVDTWKEMEKLPKEKTRAIGVSNFSEKTFAPLLKEATIIPAVNQVELHPYLQQHALREYCHSHGIVLTSYSPLGQGDTSVLEENSIISIAKKHDATPAQVILSWIVALGDTVCVKSGNSERLKSNLTYIELDEEDKDVIAKLDRNARLANGRDPKGKVFGWNFEQLGW